MSQQAIDLLPESIRARALAGLRTGQFAATLVLSVVIVVVLTTHARLRLQTSRDELERAQVDGNLVLQAEAQQTAVRQRLTEQRAIVERYQRISLPLAISEVMATVVNKLPPSVALDRIDLDAQLRKSGQSARAKAPERTDAGSGPPRRLTGEIAGFAASDQDIAELVARLESTPPFRDVSLDYSRTRLIRDQSAREFRVSFKIDLDCQYEAVLSAQGEGLGAERAVLSTSHQAPRTEHRVEEHAHVDQ